MTLAPLETHALLIWLQLLWLDIISYHGSYLIVYCLVSTAFSIIV